MPDFSRRVAIVTGASRGIGAGLVEAYRKHDYVVIANSRNITDSHDPDVLVPKNIHYGVSTHAVPVSGRVHASTILGSPFRHVVSHHDDSSGAVHEIHCLTHAFDHLAWDRRPVGKVAADHAEQLGRAET